MNFIEVYILVALLVGTSTANEIFYVLPDNSPNISCPPHHCATFSQYLLDNDGTLPVTSNVEYHLLSLEHYLNATEAVVFSNFQNFTLVGKLNEQLQLPLVILVSTNITILDSYNITITNIICDWACENRAYLHKIHMFRKSHISWSLFMVKTFCKIYLLSN